MAGDEVVVSLDPAAGPGLIVQPLVQDTPGTVKFRACNLSGADVAGPIGFSYGVIR